MSSRVSFDKLNVFYQDILVGELKRDDELVSSFTYSDQWLAHSDRFQLSLAMPLQKEAFGNKITLSFFENLLPEGETRRALEKSQHKKGTFEFLKEFGMDCAGAIIVSPNKTSPIKSTKNSKKVQIEINQIYEAIEQKRSVAEVIAELGPGYLSVAGAQDKFSAIYSGKKFYLPLNGQPTTHIIKVPIFRSGVKESVYNELFCMRLARLVGLEVPDCTVHKEGPYPLFVIQRYDRLILKDDVVQRLHQQDFCQAQGIVSEQKYEDKGGPSLKDNYELKCFHSIPSLRTFYLSGLDLFQYTHRQ
jgi:serine/threonine-protein kinase HipA